MADVLDFNEPKTEKPITAALAYASKGWPVFPCNPLTKAPLTASGFKDATVNELQIKAWWGKNPNAMVGIPTGAKTGFWVLDIDNGDGKTGVASLAEMGHDLAELMDTVVSTTASGGYHCLFRYDPANPIGNARGALRRFLDVRGDGGYIIAAGSARADGRRYIWLNPPDENEIAEAPEWLLSAIGGGGAAVDSLDFNTAQRAPLAPAARVQAIAPGTWHENTRDIVARMVREGCSDDTIAAIAPRFTEQGYSDAQTIREFLTHAQTARAKWGYQPRDLGTADAIVDPADLYRVLTIDDLSSLKPPEWRIDGIFPVHGSSTIYGAYESFKTFVALDMLLPLSEGMEWVGRVTKACPVLYIAGEGQHGLAQRILGWCAAKNEGRRPANFRVLPEAVAIPSHGNLDKLLRTIDALPEAPGVVVLDTITRMSGGGSLNDEKDMQQYVLAMDRLRLHIGGHVMNVGHSGKDKEKGLLGSVVLPAAMETIICVERTGDRLKLVNTNPKGKQKDGPNFDDICLRTELARFEQAGEASSTLVLAADEERQTDTADGPRQTPKDRRPGVNQLAITKALKRADGAPLGLTRLSQMIGKSTSDTLKAVAPMVDRGLVIQTGTDGAWRWELASEGEEI